MKHLRQYIRQILLETTIDSKIENQIEKLIDLNLTVGLTLNNYGKWIVIGVEFLDENDRRVGELHSKYDEDGWGQCNRALVISASGVKVSHGLGPLAYDIAFELASFAGLTGLGPDSREVSDEAKPVWDYYLNNRSDVTAKQRDFKENPQTTPEEDDCLGQNTLADRFPGGRDAAYTKKTHHDPVGFDDPDEGWDTVEEYSPEFIEYYFDPKNSLSKTYHKDASGMPILKYLRSQLRLRTWAAVKIGMPYTLEEVEEVIERTPKLYKRYFEEKRGKYNSKTKKWDSAVPTPEEKEAWIMKHWVNPK